MIADCGPDQFEEFVGPIWDKNIADVRAARARARAEKLYEEKVGVSLNGFAFTICIPPPA